jgi:hypothetical protein
VLVGTGTATISLYDQDRTHISDLSTGSPSNKLVCSIATDSKNSCFYEVDLDSSGNVTDIQRMDTSGNITGSVSVPGSFGPNGSYVYIPVISVNPYTGDLWLSVPGTGFYVYSKDDLSTPQQIVPFAASQKIGIIIRK